MRNKKVLFIGLVWPEPQSSAAGTRLLQLIRAFKNKGEEVVFVSAAAKSAYSHPLHEEGVKEESIQLNSSSFDELIRALLPDIVIFDRYITEEQYGWRVREHCPSALTVLDTEDLHFLRHARQDAMKRGSTEIDYENKTTLRELAAILRCDLSLIISATEMDLLLQHFNLSAKILYYLPFLEEEITTAITKQWLPYASRENFVFIGNFLHEPNWQTTRILKDEIWPKIQRKIPRAALHIYGAYAMDKVFQLHQPQANFYIKGRAADARETLSNYRILLAPIPFGAGVKGKFIDAMQAGTPSVTTSIGAESLSNQGEWQGYIADDFEQFVQKAVALYETPALWNDAQKKGVHILNKTSSKARLETPFLDYIDTLYNNLITHRQQNIIGKILQNQQHNASKYMSLWIEAKNKC